MKRSLLALGIVVVFGSLLAAVLTEREVGGSNDFISAKEIAADAHTDCVCPHCKATWVFYDRALKLLSREHAQRMDELEARIQALEAE